MCEVRERLDHALPRLLEAPVNEFAVLAVEALNDKGGSLQPQQQIQGLN